MKPEQKSFGKSTLVLGTLGLIMLALVAFSIKMSATAPVLASAGSDEYRASVAGRLRPVGDHYLPGEEASANMPQVEEAPEPEPVATVLTGPQVFNEACIACHGSGIGGAPILTDSDNWAPRIAQGLDTLRAHAIDGYTGSAGYMPPKGARLDLSDQDINGAVDYMLSQIPE